MYRSVLPVALAAAAVLALNSTAPVQAQSLPVPDYSALKPELSGEIPRVVPEFPFAAAPIDTRPMFDTFMWQNFIAIMWPSLAADHGSPYQPDNPGVFGKYDDRLLPAWMRWKSAFDLYPQNGSEPPPWGQANGTAVCRNVGADDRRPILDMMSEFGTLADELDEAFAGPLPDQTGLFTRFEVRVNQPEYDYVRSNGYYNRDRWPAPGAPGISFPTSSGAAIGSIEVKAAWRDLAKVPDRFRKRFFNVDALAAVPATCKTEPGGLVVCDCRPMKAGLVGFHIAHKTNKFPQWVWSTFEQVDNLGEDPSTPKDMQASYFDPDFHNKYKATRANPADHPGTSRVPAPNDYNPEPVNVVRLSAIPNTPAGHSTTEINASYRKFLKGTVWENYVLVGTQWSTLPSFPASAPLNADFGCEDGTPPAQGGQAFPQCQVSNATMETYHQYDSCQNCHQGAQRAGADFSWILALRAWSASGNAAAKAAIPSPHH
jgi:hypothetical protein